MVKVCSRDVLFSSRLLLKCDVLYTQQAPASDKKDVQMARMRKCSIVHFKDNENNPFIPQIYISESPQEPEKMHIFRRKLK